MKSKEKPKAGSAPKVAPKSKSEDWSIPTIKLALGTAPAGADVLSIAEAAATPGAVLPEQWKPLPDDAPLRPLIAEIVPDSAEWLTTRNSALGGRAPAEFLGGPDEVRLRELVLAYKYGDFS